MLVQSLVRSCFFFGATVFHILSENLDFQTPFTPPLGMLSCPCQFKSVIMGEYSHHGIADFWNHCKNVSTWKHHHVIHGLSTQELQYMIPCSIHADGAEMFTDDEYFVYSWSSAFSSTSLVTDVLHHRFPIAVVAEREMVDDNVLWWQQRMHLVVI